LVPGAAALLPKAPPVTDMCDPMPPPRANAAVVERPTQRATQRTKTLFMPGLLEDAINVLKTRSWQQRSCLQHNVYLDTAARLAGTLAD
jgi:hypothetical protein